MVWHASVTRRLRASGLFSEVHLAGGKVRAVLDEARFLDIHFDPTSNSYSYALINLLLPYPGDKREFGWDDFPHPGNPALQALASYPHHLQERSSDGSWLFSESDFRGNLDHDIPVVLAHLKRYLPHLVSAHPDIIGQVRQKHPRAYTPWTPEDDQALREQRVAGMSIKQLSEIHQRNEGAIRSRLNKIGIK